MSRFPQSLLEDPNVVEVAASMGMTPEQYLQSILDKPQSPILNTLEAGPRMDTGPTVATQPAPVLTPGVPGEGVIAAPVANPADAPTSYADMSPQEFQQMAQNPAGVPAGAEFPGLGADFSGIERFDSAMEQRTQAARQGIDQGVLQQQAASGDARALAELERRKNVSQISGVLPTAGNEPIPMGQAPVDFAAMEAQNSKSPVLINTTTPSPTTTTAPQTPALSTTSSTTAPRSPVLSRGAGNMTANARGSALGMIPRGEALIRIGAAGYSGALQGDGIGAAGREYGSIQDANRAAEVAAAKQAEATRIAELRARGTGAGKGKSGNLAGPPTAVYKQATLSAITRIKDLLASESGFNPFDNLTGWTGSLLSSVPGTPAHDALNSINTIEAAVGFDRLQKMRDDSPTGGALGQVTERELALLSQSLGSLKQSSSREQFVANLEAVEKHYQSAVAAVEAQQAEWYRMNGGTMPTKPTAAPSNDNLTDQELSYINQS